MRGHYPDGAAVRRDDVAEVIVPFLTVDKTLSKSLAEKSLKQKYWVNDFGDLILDRTWQEISK